MDIKLNKISIKALANKYKDNKEDGVVGYGGKLDIRPPYQREFVYDEQKREAVLHSLINNFPLNTIYWAVKKDGAYEVIDGQQRIISICQYIEGDFSINGRYFHSLQPDEKEQIYNYNLTVYFCKGTDSEKLSWFKTINIAGEKLYDQELRNAVYSGPWVTDAKRYFSKKNCVAQLKAADYLDGSPIRQDYLEDALDWISNGDINNYMSEHHHDVNAKKLWKYFEAVIDWVEETFANKRKFMKGLPWGHFYNKYKDSSLKPSKIEETIVELIKFEDKIKLKGIYEFILTGESKHIYNRKFPDNIKNKVYEKQDRKCKVCKKTFDISEMEADHIKAWFDNGETTEQNCQMLCRPHHYDKTAEQTRTLKAKLKI